MGRRTLNTQTPELISAATMVRSAPSYGLALRAASPLTLALLAHNFNLHSAVPYITTPGLISAATVVRSAPSYGLALRAAFGRKQS